MITSEQFFLNLRSALNHLYDPYFLRKSPLIHVFGLDDRPDANVVLQRILNEAIAALEPPPGAGDLGSRRAQRRKNYELIMYRYVQQFSQEEISAQLGVSVRHLRREQNAAIYDLATLLWDKYALGARPFQMESMLEDEAPSEPPVPVRPQAAAESQAAQELEVTAEPAIPVEQAALEGESDLDWLKDQPLTAPARVAEVAAAVIELVGPLCARYNVTIDNCIGLNASAPGVAAQEVALRQMLLNIFNVAIRIHTGQRVTLRAETAAAGGFNRERMLMITVSGPQEPSACRPFSTDDMGSMRITERIAMLYGGSLKWMEPGQPCQVMLALPVFRQRKVLVVDDNNDFIQLVTRSLTGTHYTVTGERSPHAVVEMVARMAPDIVLLDVMMPGLDGWEVLGRLRRHPDTARVPVIICTVLPQEELALSLGASDFLRKPVTPEQILSALDRWSAPQDSGFR